MKYKHTIWDWNGTLLDDVELCRSIINSMLQARKMPLLSLTEYREVFDFPVKKYYEKVGFDFNKECWEKVSMEFIEAYTNGVHKCSLHPHAIELLYNLKQQHIPASILSAMEASALKYLVGAFDISSYFENIVGIDTHHATSKISQGLDLITRINLPVDDIVMIGDTLHDAEVASELGIKCVLLPAGHQSIERLKGSNAEIVTDLKALAELLLE